MFPPHKIGPWAVIDSGVKTALEHMEADSKNLAALPSGDDTFPKIRFFQWSDPVVSYGYLLDPLKVKEWAENNGGYATVKRPTGGGAVLHNCNDLNLSLLWPRPLQTLSENPRTCYAQIHKALQKGLSNFVNRHSRESGNPGFELYSGSPLNTGRDDGQTNGRFSLCFQEPVCNDVMRGSKKVIGGALRITKQAILYQGTIRLDNRTDADAVKPHLIHAFKSLLCPTQDLVLQS